MPQSEFLVNTDGLDSLVKDLRRADKKLAQELAKQHRAVGREVAKWSRASMRKSSDNVAKAVAKSRGSVVGSGTARISAVVINATHKRGTAQGAALGAEFGAHVWPQFRRFVTPKWVGGFPRRGGYHALRTVRTRVRDIRDLYGRALEAWLAIVAPKSSAR